MANGRSTAADGWRNRIETHITTNFEPAWALIQRVPPLRRRVNRSLINNAILKMPTRPEPLSAMAEYTSWESLTDRTYGSRHLPPKPLPEPPLPDVDTAADLFMRRGETLLCPKSTVTFAYFAQWFTDAFLRSDRSIPRDPRRTNSNHEIDLCSIYGLKPENTRTLRAHEGGRLKSQTIAGAEHMPYLTDGGRIKPEFEGLSVLRYDQLSDEQKSTLFATGSDTTNTQLGFLMMNTLFLREHNRIAGLLADEYPGWDDDRLYATARNVMIVLLLKIVIDEYINHIAPYHFKFFVDAEAFTNEAWYRNNWMSIEFNLLYRWHSLIPSQLRAAGEDRPIRDTLYASRLLTGNRLADLFQEASLQRAGRVGLRNTDPELRETEVKSLQQARGVMLAPFNDYRELCRFPRATEFDQLTGDPETQAAVREVYGTVDRLEFYTGLFTEDPRPNSVLPAVIGRMVGMDAFSQALTNPLLAPRVFNEATFSPLGMELIRTTSTLSQLLHRNIPESPGDYVVTMTRSDWKRE